MVRPTPLGITLGIALVIPAYLITETLYQPELVAQRAFTEGIFKCVLASAVKPDRK